MSSQDLRIVFSSWPDEDQLVAEIWANDDYVGDVRHRPDGLVVALRPTGGCIEGLSVVDLLDALERAQERLGAD